MSNKQIALDVFDRIRLSFPNLISTINLADPHIEVIMEYPVQNGLIFKVSFNLQGGDELHLNAGALWVEWFPCTYPDRVEEFYNAVCGLLSGTYRIIEYHRDGKAYKALLQKPHGGGWQTIHRWGMLHWPSFRKITKIFIQNIPAA